jgi:hypothetical protein
MNEKRRDAIRNISYAGYRKHTIALVVSRFYFKKKIILSDNPHA